jgi:hypothetical protein
MSQGQTAHHDVEMVVRSGQTGKFSQPELGVRHPQARAIEHVRRTVHADHPATGRRQVPGLTAGADLSVTGAAGAAALADQPTAQALLAESDPVKQLAGFAAICHEVNTRTEPLYRILVSAAGSDPDAATLLAERSRRRGAGQDQIAGSLARAGALRPRLREREAADVIHALMSPEVYQLLVDDRGWKPQRYEQWLVQTLIDQLLPR